MVACALPDDLGEVLQALWDAIEMVVSRSGLRTAVANIAAVLPPPDSEPAANGAAR